MAASASGDNGEAHYYMSEVHVLNGELQLALDQLRLALYTPDISLIQRERFEARSQEIRDALAKQKKNRRKTKDKELRQGLTLSTAPPK